ncbi:DNA cytosine methyltransferase [Streptomyces sp. NPDC055966]|uniref:DNA cytosine methyltransferase n=1 Tax=Streptomyces sp. NPDC055966 TaxID=3345669 RepID=UPI0035DC5947
MAPLRIGSLFTGTGALDLAVMDVFDAEVVWHSQYEPPGKDGKEDKNQYAARILARHWPAVPNLGDITKVDWQAVLDAYGPVDILTGGFPCQDVSTAGKRAGLTADSRSGLWTHMARAIHELRPRLVVIENVEGLLSAEADRGLESGAEIVDEGSGSGGVLRAVGAVLGDLATLGFDAEWARVAASEVGAPHGRKRVFVYAWPADADPADLGHERCGFAWGRGDGSADGGVAVADAERVGLQGERCDAGSDAGREAAPVVGCGSSRGGEATTDADGGRCDGDAERDGGQVESGLGASCGVDAVGRGVQRSAPADAQGVGQGEGRPEPAGQQGRLDAPVGGGAVAADADGFGLRSDVLNLRSGEPDVEWGDFEPAVRRWEHVLGRPAPWPTDTLGRLSAVFTEWMMGLPDGWVTATPGLPRAAMLKALGNGVVRLQAATALTLLHRRAVDDEQPANVRAA